MREKIIKDHIKQLTVQVITPKERGTGVLITYHNHPAILTVYHCIYGKASTPHPIQADEVKFIFSNKAEYYAIAIEVVGELVILALDNNLFTMHYPKVPFAKVEYGQDYHIRGFPSGLDKPHNFTAKCNDIERVCKGSRGLGSFLVEIQSSIWLDWSMPCPINQELLMQWSVLIFVSF